MSRFTFTFVVVIASVATSPSAHGQGAAPRSGGASAANAAEGTRAGDADTSESATNDAIAGADAQETAANDASADDDASASGAAASTSANDTNANDTNAAMPADDTAPSRAPRVATILVGDPERVRRARAAELDARLGGVGLRRLDDPAMRAALLGDVREDDGLERLHAARRRLLFEDDPADALRDLGARLRVDALVVVRAAEPIRIAVFDVAAGAFFEDEPTLDDLDAAAAFVRRAARAAARRASSPQASAPSPAEAAAASPAAATGTPATTAADAHRPARRWLKSNWAYLVGGALLVGVVTGFIVRGRRQDDRDPPPILRFRPGLE